MTNELDAATGAAAELNAPVESQNTPEVATPEKGEQSQEERAEPKAPTAEERLEKERANFQRRINRKHHESAQAIAQAQAEARQLREQLERLQPKEQSQEARQPTAEDIDRIATERAREIAIATEATKRANDIAQAGRKAYGDVFMDDARTVQEEAGPLYDARKGTPTALGEAIQEADNPAALLHYLGQNPDEAAELRGLSPAALGRRVAKLEAQLAAAPAPQSAPTHKPVSGSGTPKSKTPSEMSDDEWYDKRRGR